MDSADEVTLKQVAEEADVSIGTASAALSGNRPVSPSTRARVLDAAARLSYQPLRRRATRRPAPGVPVIGVAVAEAIEVVPTSPYHGRILAGVRTGCSRWGVLLHQQLFAFTEATGIDELRSAVNGVLVIGGHSERGLATRLAESGLAHVEVDHADRARSVDAVRHDDVTGGYLATSHLLDLGHTAPPPATIAGPPDIDAARERLLGYRRALAERRLTVHPSYVRTVTFGIDSGLRAMNELLDLPVPPTAVFCGNDETAQGALVALRLRGLTAPQDCSVVGYDDCTAARTTTPPLTTIRVDCEAAGLNAVRLLLDRIEDGAQVGRTVRLQVSLVERKSTAPRRRTRV